MSILSQSMLQFPLDGPESMQQTEEKTPFMMDRSSHFLEVP
jgi:hypothetical protein